MVKPVGTNNRSTPMALPTPPIQSKSSSCVSSYQCTWGFTCIDGHCKTVKQVGDPCSTNSDCSPQEDAECIAGQDGGSRCTQFSFAAAGEACDRNKGLVCSGDATCMGKDSRQATTGVCSAAILDELPCGTSADCLYPSLCITGRCQTAADVAPTCQ